MVWLRTLEIIMTETAKHAASTSLVEVLAPLMPEGDVNKADLHQEIREILQAAIDELGVYDSGGYPLVLS